MNKKKLNKLKAFQEFTKKHHLEEYNFYCYDVYRKPILCVSKDNCFDKMEYYSKIQAPHTLIKYVKMVMEGNMKLVVPEMRHIDQLEELKENILIERLAQLL